MTLVVVVDAAAADAAVESFGKSAIVSSDGRASRLIFAAGGKDFLFNGCYFFYPRLASDI